MERPSVDLLLIGSLPLCPSARATLRRSGRSSAGAALWLLWAQRLGLLLLSRLLLLLLLRVSLLWLQRHSMHRLMHLLGIFAREADAKIATVQIVVATDGTERQRERAGSKTQVRKSNILRGAAV